ncbi:uncharacterized protein LOC141886961 [Acropora palmata]|uniref:uncharacterized protein LOC141886961 n=1 Tax=Acropora palmata TaxID=6131 RepID=UPI003D9FD921
MALIPRFAFLSLLLLPYRCEAAAENCSETQCLLLPDGVDQVASEFRLKSSEKGVRLVYINLVIGNASYDPLDLPDVFLPHRWIWANTIHEPMLSLPEDYDIFSLGLLNYQVRSIEVKLKDHPSGCLAKLNSTCQNRAVGRMLLENVTSSVSGDILHKKTPVVCVAVINTTTTDDSSEHTMSYHCCYVHKELRTGRAGIRCDEKIDVGNWVATVNMVFSVLSFFLALFAPALPLALPDYVFSLEDEVERENRLAEQTDIETTGYQCITNAATEGEQDNQLRGTGADRSNIEDTDTSTTSTNNNDTIQEETGQNTSICVANSRDQDEESKFIPVDDSSPMNVSTLLRESVQKFPDVPLSFNIKLAVMCLCVYPCVFYVQLGLYRTLKKTSIDEIREKHVQVDSVFAVAFVFVHVTPKDLVTSIVTVLTIFILVLFLKPKDFFVGENELCRLCRVLSPTNNSFNFSLASERTLGDEMHRHLTLLHHYLWYSTVAYGSIMVSIYYCLSLGCLRKKMRKESRGNHLCCVFFRLISFIFALPCIIVGGVFCLLIFIIYVSVLLFALSPVPTIILFSFVKISNRLDTQRKTFIGGLLFFWIFFFLVYFYMVGSISFLAYSCFFITAVVAYVIIGLALNVSIVTPFLAFFLVLTTNLYFCYAKLQRKYKEVKKMILEKLQELHMNSDDPKDTIRAEIYWFVCDRVLPIKSEVCLMLRNMVLVIAFLFLALSSIVFFGSKYDISTFTTTISVFFTGSIPPLFLRILTTSNNIIGWEKIKMERKIDKVVKEYRGRRNGEAGGQQIAYTQV